MKRAAVYSALPLISASQISTFRECQRKWAWRHIAKLETPPHPSAALGTEVHDTQLGPYLTEGKPFDYTRDSGYIAASLLEFLPQPKTPGMVVEKHFILPSPASGGEFAYQGYKDLWLPGGLPGSSGDIPAVVDFKTTSDLKWAKNEKALSVDVQAMLYATNALFETKAKEVDLAWLYAQTRGARKSKRTYLRVHEDHVIEQFRAIEETALEMFEAKQTVTDPLSLPPSPSQCEAYGGCPYRNRCNLSPTDYLAALGARDFSLLELNGGIDMSGVSSGTSSLLANLKARKAGAQGAVVQSEVTPERDVAGSTPASAASASEASAPPPSPSPEPALGINPPEKDLPPPETAKRGPGRPRKPKPEEAPKVDERQLELPLDAPAAAQGGESGTKAASTLSNGALIKVTTRIDDSCSFEITDHVREGETVIQALARLGISSSARSQ